MEVTQDILLPVLLAAIVVNTAILLAVVVAIRGSGRRRRLGHESPEPTFAGSLLSSSFTDRSARSTWLTGSEALPDPAPADGEPADAASADDTPTDLPSGARDGADDDVQGHGPAAIIDGARDATDVEAPADVELGTTASVDELTGLLDQTAFMRLVFAEDLRIQRYHRASTIVLFELDGLDRLVERLGPGAAERVVPALADTIRRLARKPDRVARLAPGRFAILLSETDEVAAINYIERVRRACELWLESGAIALRLAAGWAGTTGDPTLPDAMRIATERMYVEIRRHARRAPEATAEH